jgi:hypothetical protein
LTSRELRFLTFASIEYEGQIFMTPRDFLDSVTQMQPMRKSDFLSFYFMSLSN